MSKNKQLSKLPTILALLVLCAILLFFLTGVPKEKEKDANARFSLVDSDVDTATRILVNLEEEGAYL